MPGQAVKPARTVLFALSAGCSKEETSAPEQGASTGDFVSVTLPLEVGEQISAAPSAMSNSSVTAPTAPQAAVGNAPKTAASAPSEGFTVSLGECAATTATPSTRTMTQELANVWVMQFDNTGKNVSTTNTGNLTAGAHLTVPSLQVGTGYTIYIIANGHVSGLTTNVTLATIEGAMLYTSTVTDLAKMPLVGRLANVTVVDLGDGKGKISLPDDLPLVEMKRIHAEVNLTVDCNVAGYTLSSAQLYTVPRGAAYGWKNATFPYPDAQYFSYLTTASAGMTPLAATTSGTITTYQWFMAENRRGDVAGLTAQQERSSTNAPAYATFARITLTNSTTVAKKLYYDVYLGSGAVTSFDVKRNLRYTQKVTIKGSAAFQEALLDTDPRVSGEGFPEVAIYLTDRKADSPFGISFKSMEGTSSTTWGFLGIDTGATDVYDGKGNTDKLVALNSSGSEEVAAEECRNKGAEWYLPAQAQLMLMWVYLPMIPTAERPTVNSTFWSSTEYKGYPENAWNMPVSTNGSTSYTRKSTGFYVRCVRDGASPAFGSWKYPRVDGGNTIVSRDAAGGIKADAILTADQKSFLMNQTTQPMYNHNFECNKVSAKFEVASTNASTGTTWTDAYTLCKSYSQSGAAAGSWRVPTQRELMLMWIFKAKLTGCTDLTTTKGVFWSGVLGGSGDSAWYVDFSDGVGSILSWSKGYYVRCVRDL